MAREETLHDAQGNKEPSSDEVAGALNPRSPHSPSAAAEASHAHLGGTPASSSSREMGGRLTGFAGMPLLRGLEFGTTRSMEAVEAQRSAREWNAVAGAIAAASFASTAAVTRPLHPLGGKAAARTNRSAGCSFSAVQYTSPIVRGRVSLLQKRSAAGSASSGIGSMGVGDAWPLEECTRSSALNTRAGRPHDRSPMGRRSPGLKASPLEADPRTGAAARGQRMRRSSADSPTLGYAMSAAAVQGNSDVFPMLMSSMGAISLAGPLSPLGGRRYALPVTPETMFPAAASFPSARSLLRKMGGDSGSPLPGTPVLGAKSKRSPAAVGGRPGAICSWLPGTTSTHASP